MSTLRTSSCLITAAVGLALAVPPATPVALAASSGHDVAVHGMIVRGSHAARPSRSGSKLLASRGGAVQVSPKVYIVFWGWTDNTTTTNGFTYPSDPGQVAALQVAFFQHVGVAGSDDWSSSTTQYCSGVASGTTNCLAASGTVTYPAQSGSVLAGTWVDGASVPASPTQSQIAAVAAAGQ